MNNRQLRKLRKACGHSGGRKLQWRALAKGKPGMRADCVSCGQYLGYVPHTLENVQEAFAQHHEPWGCTWADCPSAQSLAVCDHKGERDLRWHLFTNRTLHLRSECCKCGQFSGFAKQTFENMQAALAQRREPKDCTWDVVLALQPQAGPETFEIIDSFMGDEPEPPIETMEW